MNSILFFLTPKAMCAYLYDDYTFRQGLEKMEQDKTKTDDTHSAV